MRRILCTLALIVIELALITICTEGYYGAWFSIVPIFFGLLIMAAWEVRLCSQSIICMFICSFHFAVLVVFQET